MRLRDKVAIVTGAAHGIGLAVPRHYVAEGAKVTIADIDAAGSGARYTALGPEIHLKAGSFLFCRSVQAHGLSHGSPRVRWLDRVIGNFLERVLVCVVFILLLLLFSGYLLVAFFPELATTAITTKNRNILRVCGHRQDRDDRSYRKSSHFPFPTTEPETQRGRRDSPGALNRAWPALTRRQLT